MAKLSTAVVTGTSTGFGFLTAQTLRAAGHNVYATMRDLQGRNLEAKRSLEALGIHVVELDVTKQASVDAAAAKILGEVTSIDVLVNNAGTAHMGVSEAFTPEAVEAQFATNLIGPIRLNRAFLPSMRAAKAGLIIHISSVVGRFVIPFTGIYAGSKFALEAYAESLSYELRPSSVDVALIEPGAYATNIFNVMSGADDQARVADYGDTAKIFEGMSGGLDASAGNPQEVADAILSLINQPAGERPLRVAVPPGSPAEEINDIVAPIQRRILEEFGMQALLPNVKVGV